MVIQLNIKKQMRYLYFYEAVISFGITDVVWVLFLLNRGYSLVQVGVAEGIFHLTSMICEIPSGMAADLFGRKKTLVFAGIAGAVASAFMGIGDWVGFIYLGMIFSAIGNAMVSGTEEAMLYDSLVESKTEYKYKKTKANMSIIGRVSSTAACLFSPISIFLGYQKVYFLSAVMNVIQVILVIQMKEPIVTKKQKKRQINELKRREKETAKELQKETIKRWQKENIKGLKKDSLSELWKRTKEHVLETLLFMRKNPKTMCKLLADAAIACPCYLTLMYLQEHLVDCGWSEQWIGVPILLIPMAGALGALIAAKANVGLLKAAVIAGVAAGAGTAFAGVSWVPLAIAGAVLARVCEGFFEILSGESVNHDLESDQRATMISVDSMLYSLLMIVISPVTGYLAEEAGMKQMFQIFGVCLIIATIIAVHFYKMWNQSHTKTRK